MDSFELAFLQYDELFSPNSKIACCEPSGEIVAIDYSNANGKQEYIMPDNETTDSFFDRMERSLKCGRNLFFEEWKKYTIVYKEGAEY